MSQILSSTKISNDKIFYRLSNGYEKTVVVTKLTTRKEALNLLNINSTPLLNFEIENKLDENGFLGYRINDWCNETGFSFFQ